MTEIDPILVDMASNFFVLFANVKVYHYNYSLWVKLSKNFHEGNIEKRL